MTSVQQKKIEKKKMEKQVKTLKFNIHTCVILTIKLQVLFTTTLKCHYKLKKLMVLYTYVYVCVMCCCDVM